MQRGAVSLESVSVWRGRGRALRQVVARLSLQIEAGQRVALIGPNGAGKTSLLLALVGAVPIEGRIVVGECVLDASTLTAIRQNVGFVFSDPQDQLFLPSVREEVAFGPLQRGLSEHEITRRTNDVLALVSLLGAEERRPSELSLGEQRRLAIASVLACQPKIVLLDEPTASLDPRARRKMLEIIANLDATVICATHDLDAALALNARVIILAGGDVLGDGPAGTLLADHALLDRAGLELPLSLSAATPAPSARTDGGTKPA
jgi:cobalt/nickel transport system ATP-binding protein